MKLFRPSLGYKGLGIGDFVVSSLQSPVSQNRDYKMSEWTNDELNRIGTAEELQIAGRKVDGTLRKPVIIWVVRVDDALYVRSYKGEGSGWFQATQERHEGRIWAGGVEKDVAFVAETAPEINDRIDDGYGEKYGRYPQYVAPMLTTDVRATTLRLVPQ